MSTATVGSAYEQNGPDDEEEIGFISGSNVTTTPRVVHDGTYLSQRGESSKTNGCCRLSLVACACFLIGSGFMFLVLGSDMAANTTTQLQPSGTIAGPHLDMSTKAPTAVVTTLVSAPLHDSIGTVPTTSLITTSTAMPSTTPSQAVSYHEFATFSIIGCSMQTNASCSTSFNDRIRNGRKYWGRELSLYFAVAEDSQKIKDMLTKWECGPLRDTKDVSTFTGRVFELWTCHGDVRQFYVLLTPCTALPAKTQFQMGWNEKSYGTSCRMSSVADYIKFANPTLFKNLKWLAVGDDDAGFMVSALLGFLGHYDFNDKLVLNYGAHTLQQQRLPAHSWNLRVRKCNHLVPAKFVTAVFSVGALEAVKYTFSDETLKELGRTFLGSYDTCVGLIFWMHRCKFIASRKYFALLGPPGEGGIKTPYIAHLLRDEKKYQELERMEADMYPGPEELQGERYDESLHYFSGLPTTKLNETNCRPAKNQTLVYRVCEPCPECPPEMPYPICGWSPEEKARIEQRKREREQLKLKR